jgi:phosphoglycerate kinase
MLEKLSLLDIDWKGKRALVRLDLNAPLNEDLSISDDTRLQKALPTINYLLDHGASVVLMSHLGRPKTGFDPSCSLKGVAERLQFLLKREVPLVSDFKPIAPLCLLENLRFYEGEKDPKNHPEFVKKLEALGDVFVCDAFGVVHRKDASVYDLPKCFPGKAVCGFLVEQEMKALKEILMTPQKPFVALIGGSKVSSKIGVLKALSQKVDTLMIGGAMAYTFLKALGISVGESLVENEFLEEAKSLIDSLGSSLLLPLDHLVVKKIGETPQQVSTIPEGFIGVDIGKKTQNLYKTVLASSKTLFWNGPMGIFETPEYAKGTYEIAKAIANLEGFTVVGGGDSVRAINEMGFSQKITHISTGGGATLEFIEKGELPGIKVLSDKIN